MLRVRISYANEAEAEQLLRILKDSARESGKIISVKGRKPGEGGVYDRVYVDMELYPKGSKTPQNDHVETQ